jgi:hypothetical protein
MGWLIGMIILAGIAGAGWLIALPSTVRWFWGGKDDDTSMSGPLALIGWGVAILFGSVGTFVAFPFAGAYHRYVPISGSVTQTVNSRFLSDGSGTTQNYLVTVNGQNYRCDDTRCSQLRKGDKVTLMCTKSFQFNATSGYVCNWGKLGLNS